MQNKFEKVAAAYATQRPELVHIDKTLVLFIDKKVEAMRYDVALPLLRKYGEVYTGKPFDYSKYAPADGRCYDEAFRMVCETEYPSLYYYEGFLCFNGEPILAHGWCMTAGGDIVDPTLAAHQHKPYLSYFGLSIRRDYASRWANTYGYVGLLDGHREGKTVGIHYDLPEYWLQDRG